ncbi:hypothetical protein B9T07_01250 [Limnospira fusiformis CCALA 023]|nr:MAG: hypothetical protein EA414_09845 [Arthrospira sp. PLM2.Bin9]
MTINISIGLVDTGNNGSFQIHIYSDIDGYLMTERGIVINCSLCQFSGGMIKGFTSPLSPTHL